MKDLEYAPEVDPAITKACDLFLAQVMALMTVDGLVVVLLESGQAVSRVVFFWEALDNADGPGEPSGHAGIHSTQEKSPPTCITLKGSGGVMGAVLICGIPFGSLGPVEPYLVQKPAEHLAALLENILLQRRLERSAQERRA